MSTKVAGTIRGKVPATFLQLGVSGVRSAADNSGMFQKAAVAFLVTMAPVMVAQIDVRSTVAERVMKLGRDASWQPVASIVVQFPTHHPQGMVKIGDTFFVSSVEVKVPTSRFSAPVDGHDRDTGQGLGHLFKIDQNGKLLADLPLGEGTMYHPGGIDYDGTNIWVPVAEYRPDSRSIIYRVDPARMHATEVFRVRRSHRRNRPRHRRPHAARRELGLAALLPLDARSRRKPTNANTPPDKLRVAEPFALRGLSGLQIRRQPQDALHRRDRTAAAGSTRCRFRLGGLDLVDLSRWPSTAPGAGAAVDAGRPRHDAQSGLDRIDRRRTRAAISCRRTPRPRSTSTTWR